MEVWAAIVAVAGTLSAAIATFILQDRAQRRRDQTARDAEQRRELRRACALLAATATRLDRLYTAELTRPRRHRYDLTQGEIREPAPVETSEVWATMTRLANELRLMTDDAELLAAVDRLTTAILSLEVLTNAEVRAELGAEDFREIVVMAHEAPRLFLDQAHQALNA